MSRILAQSVTADLCGRLFNRLLLILLFPFILVLVALPLLSAAMRRGRPGQPLAPQGDLKPGP